MSSVFLFGNVDKKGNLERDEQNEDLKEILEDKDKVEYLSKALEVNFGQNNKASNEDIVEPSKDAVDYIDENEMVEDLQPASIPKAQIFRPLSIQQVQVAQPKKKVAIRHGRLKFSELFASHVDRPVQQFRKKPLLAANHEGYDLFCDDMIEFMKPLNSRHGKQEQQIEEFEEVEEIKAKANITTDVADVDIMLSSVVLDHWEEKIIWDIKKVETPEPQQLQFRMFRNEHLDSGNWVDNIIWDEKTFKPTEFHMDDPLLIILQKEVDAIKNPEENVLQLYKKLDGKVLDRFNLSDDWKYESKKTKLARVRQTHGPIKLQHSLPALKLHPQYFKPLLHVKELRSFHRPLIKFAPNEVITFSKVKKLKKPKTKVVDPSEMMRTPKDITLKDKSKYILLEYSEEYPPAIQNIGMASLVYNYYRKKDEKDNFVPKMNNGGAFILESVDVSPFFGFGDVKPGETMQVLYNNLFRVPIWEQDVQPTDFLCVRQTYKGVTKYYLREIPNIYVAGQTYPVQEVPRPQARKITQALKMRLQVAGYRLMRADPYKRLQFEKLAKQFPMFTETQIRSKLKEFAQYLKKGENTGWWKLKTGTVLPDEDGIQKLVTPESICLNESTLVAQQRLKDTGYGADDMREMDDENESQLDIEVQLAPWTTTKNFITAASGKGMVQLFGPGDPTGCDEGFSYIRASMKEMFFHHDETEATKNAYIDNKSKNTYHKYSIVEQQKVYKHEIERIWTNQKRSLSVRLCDDKKDAGVQALKKKKLQLEERQRKEQAAAPNSNPTSPSGTNKPDEDDDASVHGSTLAGKNKMLVINRLVKNEKGEQEWKSEIVTDGRVINAYLHHRKMIEAPPRIIEGMSPETDLKARRKRRTNAHLVKLHIKQGKRPPLPEDEELSESELPNEGHVGIPQKPLPVVLNLSSVKRKKAEEKQSFPTIQLKFSKRKLSPEIDLCDIFMKIISKLASTPEYMSFVLPVSTIVAPDYLNVINNPLCLEDMKAKCKDTVYKSQQEFIADIKKITDNCLLYNGPAHPLTAVAGKMLDHTGVLLGYEREKIEKLEAALRELKEEIKEESIAEEKLAAVI